MNTDLASDLTPVNKRMRVSLLIAFSLLVAQQLPASANDHVHDHHNWVYRHPHGFSPNAAGDSVERQPVYRHHGHGTSAPGFNAVVQNPESNRRLDLNLSSETQCIVLGANIFANQDSVTITVGGVEKTLNPGSQVTAAEYIAVKQVLSAAGQSLVIGRDGTGQGGSVDFGSIVDSKDSMRASALINPYGVTVAGDFGRHSDFELHGDLTNYGSIYAYSSKTSAKEGTIHAHDINNQEGATITASGSTDLNLRADNNLNNFGTITSGASVSLTAGNEINNGSKQSVVTANNHVSLDAPGIVNRGQISSAQGNVSIVSSEPLNLTIDNRLGQIQAGNGAISVRGDHYHGTFDTVLDGGDLISSVVNLNSGQGLLSVNVGQLTGTVNETGNAVHLVAATDDLEIGKVCLAGDPTFYNTASSITVTNDITVAEALTIVAANNIIINAGSDLVAGNSTQGFPITLIAGANITTTVGGANQTSLGPIPPTNNNNGSVTINGGNAAGGVIQFNVNGSIISSQPTSLTGNGSGADVLLVAFGGTTLGSGRVNVVTGTQEILTGGRGSGNNGNITIIGPANTGAHVLPLMITTGGSGIGGSITVTAADPIANNVTYLANGSLQLGGPTIVANPTLKANGQIQFSGTTNAGEAFIQANADNLVQVTTNQSMTARQVFMNSLNGTVAVFGQVTANLLFNANANSIVTDNLGAQKGVVKSPNVILTDTTGDIGGGSTGLGFRIDGSSFGQTSLTVTGHDNVRIESLGATQVLSSSSNGNGVFEVNGHGNLNIAGGINVTNGNLNLFTDTGAIVVGGFTLTTTNGNIAILNTGLDKKLTTVSFQNTSLFTANGDITIGVGTPGVPVAGKAPKKFITVNPPVGTGAYFFGKRGITTLFPNSTLSASNSSITFNNLLNKKSIVLSGVNFNAN